MLKVAHVVRRFAFHEWGGTENVVWNTVLYQRRRGINAEILATAALSKPGEEIHQGIQIRRFRHWYPYFPMTKQIREILDKKGGSPYVPALFRMLRKEPYDLIHIHCGGRMAQISASLARRRDIPCVITLHGGSADVPKSEIRRMMKPVKGKFHYGGVIDRMLKKRCDPLAAADAVICLNRNEEAILKAKYPGRRIIHLPNGVDDSGFRVKPGYSVRREWRIPAGCSLIVCTARIDHQKNQLILLRLLADEPQSHLILIGPVTSAHYYREITAEAERLKVSGRLTVIPGLPPGDPRLKAVLHEADIFILPSVHEPFGIAVLEAMAAGIPVIASNAGGLRDLIVNERNGLLFASGDYDGLRNAYRQLNGDLLLREKLIRQATLDVRKYSWDSLMERLMLLYRELMYAKS